MSLDYEGNYREAVNFPLLQSPTYITAMNKFIETPVGLFQRIPSEFKVAPKAPAFNNRYRVYF